KGGSMSQEVQKSNGNAGEGELAERSDPERSGGERSGASSPSPAAATGRGPASPAMHEHTQSGAVQPRSEGLEGLGEADPGDEPSGAGGEEEGDGIARSPCLASPMKGRRLAPKDAKPSPLTPEQRLLLLDTWQRSSLPAGDFASLVGISKHTLYAWKKRVDAEGPAGRLEPAPARGCVRPSPPACRHAS